MDPTYMTFINMKVTGQFTFLELSF